MAIYSIPPTLDDLAKLAEAVLADLPPLLAAQCQGLLLRIDEFPDAETETEMELLGLYRGMALAGRDSPPTGAEPDRVFLYRRPLLDHWCETETDLADLVRHVLIHEIGHHFGFSDDDMAALEAEADEI
jgi:predicted Zn-dependent protease with MMP-like domain